MIDPTYTVEDENLKIVPLKELGEDKFINKENICYVNSTNLSFCCKGKIFEIEQLIKIIENITDFLISEPDLTAQIFNLKYLYEYFVSDERVIYLNELLNKLRKESNLLIRSFYRGLSKKSHFEMKFLAERAELMAEIIAVDHPNVHLGIFRENKKMLMIKFKEFSQLFPEFKFYTVLTDKRFDYNYLVAHKQESTNLSDFANLDSLLNITSYCEKILVDFQFFSMILPLVHLLLQISRNYEIANDNLIDILEHFKFEIQGKFYQYTRHNLVFIVNYCAERNTKLDRATFYGRFLDSYF